MYVEDFDAELWLVNEIKRLHKRRQVVVEQATREGKSRPTRGHVVKAIDHEIEGLLKGLSVIQMHKECEANGRANIRFVHLNDIVNEPNTMIEKYPACKLCGARGPHYCTGKPSNSSAPGWYSSSEDLELEGRRD